MTCCISFAEPATLNVLNSVRAHEKDINNVTISPNDKLIATASQDKTAKVRFIDWLSTKDDHCFKINHHNCT